MWVIKLGGSLADSPALAGWLERLVPAASSTVLVPGGGPFADRVREAQARWEFDDATAHRMALLAMAQYGLMLCGLNPRLAPAASVAEMVQAQQAGRLPVWMPEAMALADPDIAQDWSVTSDSLALWLARRVEAAGVLLVKSAELPGGTVSAARLQRLGVLDSGFHRQRVECPVWVVQRNREVTSPALWRDGIAPDGVCRVVVDGDTNLQAGSAAGDTTGSHHCSEAAFSASRT